jgi:hypothetical protein
LNLARPENGPVEHRLVRMGSLDPAPKSEMIVSETSLGPMVADDKNKLIGSQLDSQTGKNFPQELSNEGIRKATNEYDSSSKIPERPPAPKKLVVVEADGQSRSGELSESEDEGEEENEYRALVAIKDTDGNVAQTLVAFDTGSPSNFISSNALASIGPLRVYPLSAGSIRAYRSPTSHEQVIVPKSFIVVNISKEEIGFRDTKVRLKVIDSMDDPCGAEIILGFKFIQKHGGATFLKSAEFSKSDYPTNLCSQSNPLALQGMHCKSQEQRNSSNMKCSRSNRYGPRIPKARKSRKSGELPIIEWDTRRIIHGDWRKLCTNSLAPS